MISFLCFVGGVIGLGGALHPLAAVGLGDRDREFAVEDESEALEVLGEGYGVVARVQGHPVRDVKEEICVIVLLADVRLGDRVDLVGGRDLEAEQDELARVGGRLGGEVDVGVPLKHRLEVRGEGGLGVNGEGRVGRVPGGDDVSPLDGVGLNGRPRVLDYDVLELDVQRVGEEAEVGREGVQGSIGVLDLDGRSLVGDEGVGVELGDVNPVDLDRLSGGGQRVESILWQFQFASFWLACPPGGLRGGVSRVGGLFCASHWGSWLLGIVARGRALAFGALGCVQYACR